MTKESLPLITTIDNKDTDTKDRSRSEQMTGLIAEFIDDWNTIITSKRISRITQIKSGKRLIQLKAQLKDKFFLDYYREAMKKVNDDWWANGFGGDKSWTATVQWFTRHLDHLIRKRADEMTYLESVKNPVIKSSVKQMIKSFDKQIEKVKKRIGDHLDNHPDLKRNKELLTSIPGIGDLTAGILLSEINGSLEPKKQVAHAGLAPRERQSGMRKGKSMLCKTGNRRLRTALFMPTLAAIRYNPVISRFYMKLISKGKPKMVAVAACMRRLLHIVIGVLKNQILFDPDYERSSLDN